VTDKNPRLYIGCISGTSVDGLDVALISLDSQESVKIIDASTIKMPVRLREQLLNLGVPGLGIPGQDDLDVVGQCDIDLGVFIGTSLRSFLETHKLSPGQITAIGSHGQTVRHRPPDQVRPLGFTTQIGDPNQIAEITGVQTVADFRRRDMAAGGHGAPLVPPFHQKLFQHVAANTVVLNIGGISNISILGSPTTGFDTGPGNALMDNWSARHLGKAFDEGGAWGASGHMDQTLLAHCLADPYLILAPPKSTGREYFNLAWLEQHLANANLDPADVQATLCEYTALCTTNALQQWAPDTEVLVVCGGGRLNGALMQRLQEHTQAKVCASEAFDIDGDSIEAALFGWLAHRTLSGQSGNEPAVTGAADYRVLGAVYAP
jgi:anhydro-N-acetylmuramic acid kinase